MAIMAWRRRKWQHGEKWRNWHQLSVIMPKEIINVAARKRRHRNENRSVMNNERKKIMAMNGRQNNGGEMA
jgi:hypothetical protein